MGCLKKSTASGDLGANGADAQNAAAKSLGIEPLLNSLSMVVRAANPEQGEKLWGATTSRAMRKLGVVGESGRSGVNARKLVARVASVDVLDHSRSKPNLQKLTRRGS